MCVSKTNVKFAISKPVCTPSLPCCHGYLCCHTWNSGRLVFVSQLGSANVIPTINDLDSKPPLGCWKLSAQFCIKKHPDKFPRHLNRCSMTHHKSLFKALIPKVCLDVCFLCDLSMQKPKFQKTRLINFIWLSCAAGSKSLCVGLKKWETSRKRKWSSSNL